MKTQTTITKTNFAKRYGNLRDIRRHNNTFTICEFTQGVIDYFVCFC